MQNDAPERTFPPSAVLPDCSPVTSVAGAASERGWSLVQVSPGSPGTGEGQPDEMEMTFLSDLEHSRALSQNSAQLRLFLLLSWSPFFILKQFQTYKNVAKIVTIRSKISFKFH